ncbi:MAG TPA: chemotaxis protein CheB [Solirubrobacter sp.]|nr:chemotaxis protein CheB [Solirubrobacter sp.]
MTSGAAFDVVLIAASQGGLSVCRRILAPLPADYPAAIVYAQHRRPGGSVAPRDLLARWTALEVRSGAEGDPLVPGTVTVPPADVHVRISPDRRLAFEPGSPGVELADELFASAAEVYGRRALAVVLSGRLHDGTRGVQAIKARSGRVIVQDPASAEQPSMPWNALATGCVDLVLDPPRIADALVALVTVPGADELFRVRGGSWTASPSAF